MTSSSTFASSFSLKMPLTFPVTSHTDFVGQGSAFVAIKGMREDGSMYIPLALARGARTIVLEEQVELDSDTLKQIDLYGAIIKRVENSRAALAQLSGSALGWPSRKLHIIAVTGTKGKTTTSFLLEHLFRKAGYKTALLSSVKNRIIDRDFSTALTTQHPDYLHVFLDLCVQAGVERVIMEVAAQAVSLHRIDGILFDAMVFTNFAQEHGEFYPSLGEYFDAKKALLNNLKPYAPCVLNLDDERVVALSSLCQRPVFFSLGAHNSDNTSDKMKTEVILDETSVQEGIKGTVIIAQQRMPFELPVFIGRYNGANCAAAFACAQALGISLQILTESCRSFAGVPGRLQRITLPNGAHACIDYASNPLSFKAILETLRPLTHKLILVFGSGGDREKERRMLIGELASNYADHIILTTDNPRSEDPRVIMEDITKGIPLKDHSKVIYELDREQAIYKAYALSDSGTLIALLGKGAEEYQIAKGVKTYFSEIKILENIKNSSMVYAVNYSKSAQAEGVLYKNS